MTQTVRPHAEFTYSDEDDEISLEFAVFFSRVDGGFEDVEFHLESIGGLNQSVGRAPRRVIKDESIAKFEREMEARYVDSPLDRERVNRAIRARLED